MNGGRLPERHAAAAQRQRGPAPLPAPVRRHQRARRWASSRRAPELRPRQRLPGAQLPPPRAAARHRRGVRLQARRRRAEAQRHGRRAALLRGSPSRCSDGAPVPACCGEGGSPLRNPPPATSARSRRPRDAMTSIAVVGAGPAGLTALVALQRAGIDATCFEKGDRPGGLWAYGAPLSGAYRSLHLNTSRERTELAGVPDARPTGPTSPRTSTSGATSRATSSTRAWATGSATAPPSRRPSAAAAAAGPCAAEDGFEGDFDVPGGGQRPQLGAAAARPAVPGRVRRAPGARARLPRGPELFEGRRVLVVGMGNCADGHRGRVLDRRGADASSPPAAARGSCPSTCSASPPTRSPRRRWPGCRGSCASRSPTRCCAWPSASRESYGLPAASGGLPARPPHDQRRRALAPDPRRDRGAARASSALDGDGVVFTDGSRERGRRDRVVHRLPRHRAVRGRRRARARRRTSCRCSSGSSTTSTTTCSSSAWCRPPARRSRWSSASAQLLADHLTGPLRAARQAAARRRRRAPPRRGRASATASTSARTCGWSSTASCASWRWSTGAGGAGPGAR